MYKLLDETGAELLRSETEIVYSPVNPGWHSNNGQVITIDSDKKYSVEEFTPEPTE